MDFDTAIRSNTGGRDKNQDDTDHVETDSVVAWMLADGLGGYPGGSLASSLATRAMRRVCRARGETSAETVRAAAQAAQEAIQDRQRQHLEYSRMRTTFVLLVADPATGHALWGHAGDSRLYHFRDGSIVNQTTDHSAVQALVEAGDIEPSEARDHALGHRITRCLGDEGSANPDVREPPSPLRPEDALLLCSDGFWEGVTDVQMLNALAAADSVDAWVDRMSEKLEAKADEDQDNYTAVAIWGPDTGE